MEYLNHMLFLLALATLAFAIPRSPSSTDPLYLSKYLPHNPDLARSLSQVSLPGYTFPSYSGLITVNKEYNSNIFFWFFLAENSSSTAPVVVWLQGGPGASSLFGLFGENGPFSVNVDGKTLQQRDSRWTRDFNMLYIDNPVGVGFSFTQNLNGYSTSQEEISLNLVNFLEQFYMIYSDFSRNPLFIAGESYGGKYTPSFAYAILKANSKLSPPIPLAGISIGDGLMDPILQFSGYAELAYSFGLADLNERRQIEQYENKYLNELKHGNALEAFKIFDEFINGDFYPYPTYFYNITGTSNYFNIATPVYPPNPYGSFINLPDTRENIHVGSLPYFGYNSSVEKHLINDWMASVMEKVEALLDAGVRALVYNGQYDVILSAPQCENFLRALNWQGKKEFNEARKQVWKVSPGDSEPAGYVRQARGLTQVLVRGAGHMVPADQPQRSLDMIRRFIYEKPWSR